jgi:hypothetical protein
MMEPSCTEVEGVAGDSTPAGLNSGQRERAEDPSPLVTVIGGGLDQRKGYPPGCLPTARVDRDWPVNAP